MSSQVRKRSSAPGVPQSMQNTSWPWATSHSISERVGPRSSTYQRLISDGTSSTGVRKRGRAPDAGANRSSRHLFSVHTTVCGVVPTAGGPFGARFSSETIESRGDLLGGFIGDLGVEAFEAV